ncbi:MAG: hypothetical protein J6E38_05300 [Clostridia bacterium]|nr:hypothetical protein [Clostridia bacterium]
MFKKIMLAVFCMVAIVAASGCTAEKTDDTPVKDVDNEIEVTLPAEDDKKDKEDKIELNIKPLEETDEKTLSEAAASLGFENTKFFHAVANAIGKRPEEMTQADIDKVHYIAVGPDDESSYSVFIGYIDYVDLCFSENANDEDIMSQLNELVMMSELEYDAENDSLSDLGNFKNVEMFEIYNVNTPDVSFIKNYEILALGYFNNNGITDVSCLEGYAPETLSELDFTGNDIKDWSPLYPIKEKVIVYYDLTNGFLLDLESYLEQQENPVELPKQEETETAEKAENNDEFVILDENGNPADFSSLFD